MDAVRLDPYGIADAIDDQQTLADHIESRLEDIEIDFYEHLTTTGIIRVNGMGTMSRDQFLSFLIDNEFNPQQAIKWLACHHLSKDCEYDEHCHLSGCAVHNYAISRGYCNG